MSTIGILGGGQLARMLALAAAPLGLRLLVLDSAADACAGQFAPMLHADYTDHAALAQFAERVDVATFDFENVPAASARWLTERVPVFPNPRALATAQDRLAEKSLFRELGIPVPAFADIASRADLDAAIARIGTPCILKTRRLGYDGKGQFRITAGLGTRDSGLRRQDAGANGESGPLGGAQERSVLGKADADAAWEALGAQVGTVGLILEAFVPFQREVSVVAVRSREGEFRAWPLTENWHDHGILAASLAPAVVDAQLAEKAVAHARAVAQALDYVGVFALELFVADGQLLANEMAPRVHNSGHWTIEGAETSQFENHLRAVLGLPLGSTRMVGHACMLNWIGELPDAVAVLADPCGHWHDYGKSPRAGRKVGHATLRADTPSALADALRRVGDALGRRRQVDPVIARLAGCGRT
ncbi:MAG: 5-(carboxyamino)imidazole ribonucleotide synthase [Proteobacteria bacterium]|nr:5-(carboxyamino)imidazole ribonucleotide synthase [Pseudomonadota bacterium]